MRSRPTPNGHLPRLPQSIEAGHPAVVLSTGGVDSTVLLYWFLNHGVRIIPLFIDYGQHFAETELATLQAVCPPAARQNIAVVDMRTIFAGSPSRLIRAPNLWTDHVRADELQLPYRNVLVLTAGAAFAAARDIRHIAGAFIDANQVREPDARAGFLATMQRVIGRTGRVRVHAPFARLTKREVVRGGLELGAPIALTFSCHGSATAHCGACPNCVDRLAAFAASRRG